MKKTCIDVLALLILLACAGLIKYHQTVSATDITWVDKVAGSEVTVADYAEIKAAVNSKLDAITV